MGEKRCPFTQPVVTKIEPAEDKKTAVFSASPFACASADCALWTGDACAFVQIAKEMEAQAELVNKIGVVTSNISEAVEEINIFTTEINDNTRRLIDEVGDVKAEQRRAGGTK